MDQLNPNTVLDSNSLFWLPEATPRQPMSLVELSDYCLYTSSNGNCTELLPVQLNGTEYLTDTALDPYLLLLLNWSRPYRRYVLTHTHRERERAFLLSLQLVDMTVRSPDKEGEILIHGITRPPNLV